MSTLDLVAEYDAIKKAVELEAGDLLDIRRRAEMLRRTYIHSAGNHVFSLIAAHGALWAYHYFEVGGRIGRLIAHRYFYNATEREFRLNLLMQFAEGFRKVNRQVFIDTLANYRFVERHGHSPGADSVIQPELLDALNRVHHARRTEQPLSEDEKQAVFQASFKWEQELTVAPGVQLAVAGFDCRIMRSLCLKPLVRFAYFPAWRYMWFSDFSNKDERIAKGLVAYQFGRRRGWSAVLDSLVSYGLIGAATNQPALA